MDKRDEGRKDRFRDRRGRKSKESIAEDIASEENLTVKDLQQPGRSQPETRFRQQAMAAMYDAGYGPVEIAEFFNRSKGTVSHAVKKYESTDSS